jgi:hypothetical protein
VQASESASFLQASSSKFRHSWPGIFTCIQAFKMSSRSSEERDGEKGRGEGQEELPPAMTKWMAAMQAEMAALVAQVTTALAANSVAIKAAEERAAAAAERVAAAEKKAAAAAAREAARAMEVDALRAGLARRADVQAQQVQRARQGRPRRRAPRWMAPTTPSWATRCPRFRRAPRQWRTKRGCRRRRRYCSPRS